MDNFAYKLLVGLQNFIDLIFEPALNFFDHWVSCQVPVSMSPEQAGNFKHKMGRTEKNLQALGLDELVQGLNKHTDKVMKNLERAAEANQLCNRVENWTAEMSNLSNAAKVADIQAGLKTFKEYRDHVNRLSRTLDLKELGDAKESLLKVQTRLKDVLKRQTKRAEDIWNLPVKSEEDIETAYREVRALLEIYDGNDADCADFVLMQKILLIFKGDFQTLSDLSMTWEAFEEKAARLAQECDSSWDEYDEQPWPIEETYEAFAETIREKRKEAANSWIETHSVEKSEIAGLGIRKANQVLESLKYAPPVLSPKEMEDVRTLQKAVEKYLSEKEIEWLLEKFRLLSADVQEAFISRAREIAGLS